MFLLDLALLGVGGAIFAIVIVLPLTASVLVYSFVERKHRRAWTSRSLPPVRIGDGPYRGSDVAIARLERAPTLVRAASLVGFYWSWLCLVSWMGTVLVADDHLDLLVLSMTGMLVSVATWWAGAALVKRRPSAVRLARRVAFVIAAYAVVVLVAATVMGDASGIGPAGIFAALSLAVAALMAAAARRHGHLFVADDVSGRRGGGLPAWLAVILRRRHAQRRANLFSKASQTSAGA